MKTLFNRSLYTSQSYAALTLRSILAIVLFAHGAQSMLGWYGGTGFRASMLYLTQVENLPVAIAFSVIFLQFFGPILLAVGLFTRFVSIAIAGLFIGMIVTVHLDHGFFMNWFGTSKGEGYEYHILVIGFCVALVIQGAGASSLDRYIVSKKIIS